MRSIFGAVLVLVLLSGCGAASSLDEDGDGSLGTDSSPGCGVSEATAKQMCLDAQSCGLGLPVEPALSECMAELIGCKSYRNLLLACDPAPWQCEERCE